MIHTENGPLKPKCITQYVECFSQSILLHQLVSKLLQMLWRSLLSCQKPSLCRVLPHRVRFVKYANSDLGAVHSGSRNPRSKNICAHWKWQQWDSRVP